MTLTERYDALVKDALDEVELLARSRLLALDTTHPHRRIEFVMANGTTAFFANGVLLTNSRGTALAKFLDVWDERLHLTGSPMRFTLDSPRRTEW